MAAAAAQPPDPLWHTSVPYHDKTLVDDAILVEPDLGLRPTLSAWWAEETLCKVFGPNAINAAKRDEDATNKLFTNRLVSFTKSLQSDGADDEEQQTAGEDPSEAAHAWPYPKNASAWRQTPVA